MIETILCLFERGRVNEKAVGKNLVSVSALLNVSLDFLTRLDLSRLFIMTVQ